MAYISDYPKGTIGLGSKGVFELGLFKALHIGVLSLTRSPSGPFSLFCGLIGSLYNYPIPNREPFFPLATGDSS